MRYRPSPPARRSPRLGSHWLRAAWPRTRDPAGARVRGEARRACQRTRHPDRGDAARPDAWRGHPSAAPYGPRDMPPSTQRSALARPASASQAVAGQREVRQDAVDNASRHEPARSSGRGLMSSTGGAGVETARSPCRRWEALGAARPSTRRRGGARAGGTSTRGFTQRQRPGPGQASPVRGSRPLERFGCGGSMAEPLRHRACHASGNSRARGCDRRTTDRNERQARPRGALPPAGRRLPPMRPAPRAA